VEASKDRTAPDSTEPGELVAEIAAASAETIALLTMVRVFCNLEQRDMDPDCVDGTLSDAAEGLSVLMGDLAQRVETIQNKVDQFYELWPSSEPAPRESPMSRAAPRRPRPLAQPSSGTIEPSS
jgi:hypothetical protein